MMNRNPTSRHSPYPSSILPVKCSGLSSHLNLINPPKTTRRLSVEPDLFTPSRIHTEAECDRQYSEKKLFGRFDTIMDNNSSSKFQSDPYFHNHPKSTRKSSSSFLTLPDYPSSTKAQSSSIVTFNQVNNASKGGIDNFINPIITNSSSSLKKNGGISSLLTPLADDKFRFMEKQATRNTKFESLFQNSVQSTPKGPANKLASAFPHSSLKNLVNSYQNSKQQSTSITQQLQQTQQKASREPSPRTSTPSLCPQFNLFALKKQIEKLSSSKTLTPAKNAFFKDNELTQQLETKQQDQPQELIGSQKQSQTQLESKKQPFHSRTQSACVNSGNNITKPSQSSTPSETLKYQQQQFSSTALQTDSLRKSKDLDNKKSSNSSTIEEVWESLKASRKNKSNLSLQDFTFLDQQSCRIEVSEQPSARIADRESQRENIGEYDTNHAEKHTKEDSQMVFQRNKEIREQSESDISVNLENIMSKYQDTRESSDEMEEYNKIEVVKKIDFDENQEIEKKFIANSKDSKLQKEDLRGDSKMIHGKDENIKKNSNHLGTDFSGIKISSEISSMQIKTLANLFLLCDTDALSEDYLRELSALKESIVSVLKKNS